MASVLPLCNIDLKPSYQDYSRMIHRTCGSLITVPMCTTTSWPFEDSRSRSYSMETIHDPFVDLSDNTKLQKNYVHNICNQTDDHKIKSSSLSTLSTPSTSSSFSPLNKKKTPSLGNLVEYQYSTDVFPIHEVLSSGSDVKLRDKTKLSLYKNVLSVPHKFSPFFSPHNRRRAPSYDSIKDEDTNNYLNKPKIRHRSSLGCESELHTVKKNTTRPLLPARKINFHSPFASPFIRKRTSSVADTPEERQQNHEETIQAIQSNDCRRVKVLIKRYILDDFSLLNEACCKGCTRCIKNLLRARCNVNAIDETNWSTLHTAVYIGNHNIVKILLTNNSEVNSISDDGWTPLLLATYLADATTVQELVRSGADPILSLDSCRVTPFQLAIDMKHKPIIDYFIHLPNFLVSI